MMRVWKEYPDGTRWEVWLDDDGVFRAADDDPHGQLFAASLNAFDSPAEHSVADGVFGPPQLRAFAELMGAEVDIPDPPAGPPRVY